MASESEWHSLCLRGGCLAKLPGPALRRLLKQIPGVPVPWEDAAPVPNTAESILTSIDFGPLVCPDPRTAGRIAALNAFSDIYAVGGTPEIALGIVVIDTAKPFAFAEEMLGGICDACTTDGVVLAGGQTITGSECLAGLSVIGRANGAVLRKHGAIAGDELLLSKPLGSGLLLWAYSVAAADGAALTSAVELMLTSNGPAARAAAAAQPHAGTDISGFGLLGHLSEMLGDGIGAVVELDRVPLLPAVRVLPPALRSTSAVGANSDYVTQSTALRTTRGDAELAPLFDAQTNGGLLVAVAPELTQMLENAGFTSIGRITGDAGIVVT